MEAAMIIINYIAVDYRRYLIRNCKFPYPFPVELVGYHLWEVVDPFLMEFDWDLGHVTLSFDQGYRYDGASIPILFGNIVDPIAALIGSTPHDLLYATCAGARPYKIWTNDTDFIEKPLIDTTTGVPPVFDGVNPVDSERRRARADAILRAFWITSGMPEEMAEKGYAAVRCFGRKAWDDLE
jgi:hypothetical protein